MAGFMVPFMKNVSGIGRVNNGEPHPPPPPPPNIKTSTFNVSFTIKKNTLKYLLVFLNFEFTLPPTI